MTKSMNELAHKSPLIFGSWAGGIQQIPQSDWFLEGGGISSYAPLQRAESIKVIHFREWISDYRQSFARFTLPKTINQCKFISIHL